jgi:hypothetical protein
MKILVRNADGSTREVDYKPTPIDTKRKAFYAYLVRKGSRPSEAAMQVATMKDGKIHKLYRSLVILGETKQ